MDPGDSETTQAMRRATAERISERKIVVRRVIRGPARLVFEAWTRPELFQRWWVPKAAPITLLSCELDVRAGGRYRLVFGVNGTDQQAEFFGRYLEVTPHTRLVWTNDEGEEGGPVTTVTFEAYSESPPCTAYTSNSPGGAGSQDDFRIVFTTPVRNFRFVSLGDQTDGKYGVADVLTEDGGTGTLNLVGDGGSSSGEVQDFSEWENIVEIQIRDITDPYTVNIDDLSFEQRD